MSLDDPQKTQNPPLSDQANETFEKVTKYEAMEKTFIALNKNVKSFILRNKDNNLRKEAAQFVVSYLMLSLQKHDDQEIADILSTEGAVEELVNYDQVANVARLMGAVEDKAKSQILKTPGVIRVITSSKAQETPTIQAQFSHITAILINEMHSLLHEEKALEEPAIKGEEVTADFQPPEIK